MKKLVTPLVAAAIIGGAGVSLVQAHEGVRYKTYLDAVGIPTVCYGHTGPEVKLGQTYTPAKCEALFNADVIKHNDEVNKCVKAPLTRNQRAGVVSFAFNVGGTKFCRSTLAKKLNRLDYIGAADEFPKWKYANVGGKNVVLRGLVARRSAERALFLTQDARMAPAASAERLRGLLAVSSS